MQARALADADTPPCRTGTSRPTRRTRTRGKKAPRTPTPATRRGGGRINVGHGTRDNDRVPIAGAVGRQSGRLALEVVRRPNRAELVDDFVLPTTAAGSTVYTDEWGVYRSLPKPGRGHATVCRLRYQWARDDDGDGVREVHDNTLEGIWTGLRNFLRLFRGVNKAYRPGMWPCSSGRTTSRRWPRSSSARCPADQRPPFLGHERSRFVRFGTRGSDKVTGESSSLARPRGVRHGVRERSSPPGWRRG